MSSERINGLKLNLEAMSDTELVNLVAYRIEALERAATEVERLTGILRDRGVITDMPEGVHQDTLFAVE